MVTTTTNRNTGWNILSVFLVLPTVFFILFSVLKYEFGVDGPMDAVWPFLESLGVKEDIGFNINLLILFGPVLAVVIALFQVLHIEFHFSKEIWQFHARVQKKWIPLTVIFTSGLVMALLFIYMIGENCSC